MTLKDTFNIAFDGLKTNKSRSALTILGIVIGITAIMLIVSIGHGAEKLILEQLGGMGADLIVVRPGKEPKGPSDIADTLFADSLKNSDVVALGKKSNVPDIVEIVPAVIVSGNVSRGGETFRPAMFGWSAEFMSEVFDIYPEEGVPFSESDIRGKASVAVIGSKVKKELFGSSSALGENIRIKNRNFRVVGVFPQRGQVSFLNVDEIVVIPYTTAQSYLLGIDYYHEVMVRVGSPDVVARAVRDIELTLRETHNITDPNKDDFFVVTQKGLVEQVGAILSVLTLFLSSVVAISLVVGGIGVMNIMLVSVTERTKEIGLRKALGATERDILTQFLIESMLLTGIGGAVGILLGTLFSFATSFVLTNIFGLSWVFTFPLFAALLGIGVSVAVGLLFGIYPARQASLKSPMEALRYE
ncbi:MAG: ABC transporter permease [Patescibacteria group bacterium]|nr:MAG: ABC transporter permease [Patescibacteria group bacterium]